MAKALRSARILVLVRTRNLNFGVLRNPEIATRQVRVSNSFSPAFLGGKHVFFFGGRPQRHLRAERFDDIGLKDPLIRGVHSSTLASQRRQEP